MTLDTPSRPNPPALSTVGLDSHSVEPLELDEIRGRGESAVEPIATATDDAPQWFQQKRTKRADRQAAKQHRRNNGSSIVIDMENGEELSWSEKLARWITGFAAMGFGVSLIVHAVLLFALSLEILKEAGYFGFTTQLTESKYNRLELEDVLDTKLDMPGGGGQLVELQQMRIFDLDTAIPQRDLDRKIAEAIGKGAGLSDSEEVDRDFKFSMPTSGKAVTKGSFTVWTDPEDPEPRQEYDIIIQIKLPKRVKRYRSSDLSGSVRGSDKFYQVIPWDPKAPKSPRFPGRRGKLKFLKKNGYLPIKIGLTQLVIRIPGALKAQVEDEIEIHSETLKEKQTLKIVF